MARITWTGNTGGAWTTSSYWNGFAVPGPADDAVIDVAPPAGSSYGVYYNANLRVHSVTLAQASAVLTLGGGVLTTALTLTAGQLQFSGGSLSGTLAQTGGVILPVATGTLSGETISGDIALQVADVGNLTIGSGLTLAGGTLAIDTLGGYDSTVRGWVTGTVSLAGSQTLGGGTLALSTPVPAGQPLLRQGRVEISAGSTATLAQSLTLVSSNEWFGGGGTLVNEGHFLATGITDLSWLGSLVNSGTLEVRGTALTFGNAVTNTGTILVGLGGGLIVSGAAWAASGGTAIVDGGTLNVVNPTGVDDFRRATYLNGGGALLSGTLVNSGSTTFGTGGLPSIGLDFSARIEGGTLSTKGISLGGGTLSNLTLVGTLNIDATSEATLAGNIRMQGANGTGRGTIVSQARYATLMLGSAQLSNTAIVWSAQPIRAAGGTLGADSLLEITRNPVTKSTGSGFDVLNGSVFTNLGTIQVDTAAYGEVSGPISNQGTVLVQGTLMASGWQEIGHVAIDGGTLMVHGDSVLPHFAGVTSVHGGVLALDTNIDNQGSTLTLRGSLTRLGLNGATILGGTVVNPGGGAIAGGFSGTLAGVSFVGPLSVGSVHETLVLRSGFRLSANTAGQRGAISVTGAGAILQIQDGIALSATTISIGAASATATLAGGGGAQGGALVLGKAVRVNQTGKLAALAGKIVSYGTISANSAGGTLRLAGGAGPAGFSNLGTLAVARETLLLDNTGQNAALTANTVLNRGLITLTGATVAEASAKLPALTLTNFGTIAGTGTLAVPLLNNGVVETGTGTLAIAGAVSGTGTLQVDGGGRLDLLGGVAATETLVFAGGASVLGLAPKKFLGTIAGFAVGDTLDLRSTGASGASFSGSSIVVTLTAGGTISLKTASALAGSLTVTAGTAGDTLITYASTAPLAPPDPAGSAWLPALPATEAFWPAVPTH